MRRRARADVLEGLLNRVRYEVLPTAGVVDAVAGGLPGGATVTVTASPSKGLDATLDVAERLAALGYDVVPHLAARMIAGPGELAEITARLRSAGVTKVFVPAGDAEPAAGAYDSALPLLRDLAAAGHPFTDIGITGYPESHPGIHDDLTIQVAAPGGYDPSRFLDRAAATLGRADLHVAGLHLFTFNQVAETEAWRVAQLARLHGPGDQAGARAPGVPGWGLS